MTLPEGIRTIVEASPLWKEDGSQFPPLTRAFFREHRELFLKQYILGITEESMYKNKNDLKIYRRLREHLINEVKSLPGIGEARALTFVQLSGAQAFTNYRSYINRQVAYKLATKLLVMDLDSLYAHWCRALTVLDETPEKLLTYLSPKVVQEASRGNMIPRSCKLFTRDNVRVLREWRAAWVEQ